MDIVIDAPHDAGDVFAPLLSGYGDAPLVGVAYVVEVYAVDIVAACDFLAHVGHVVGCLRLLRVEETVLPDLLHNGGVALADCTAAGTVPLADGHGDEPCVELHAAAMTLVDGKLQRVVAWRARGCSRETGIPGLQARGIDGRGPHARLQEHGVDAALLQAVEHAAELLPLQLGHLWTGGFGAWPVDAADGGEPHGAYFIFRWLLLAAAGVEHLCPRARHSRHGKQKKDYSFVCYHCFRMQK